MCENSLCAFFILDREKNTSSGMWPDRNHIVHDWKVFRNRCSVKINILFPHFIVKVKNKLHCYFENTGCVLIFSSHAKRWGLFPPSLLCHA